MNAPAPRRAPGRAPRPAGASLLSLALLACAAAPPPPRPPPPIDTAPLASASAAPAPETPDEEFRKRPPLASSDGSFQAPVPVDVKLPNGMRVLLLSNHGMPVVSMRLVVSRGASHGPPGVASLLGPMLLQGTPSRPFFALSDALEALGARYRVTIDDDALLLSATVLAPQADKTLMLLADVLRNASLPEASLPQLKARKALTIAAERDLSHVQLQRAVAELLYPEKHPYRASALVDEADIKAVKRADLVRFHREHVQPGTTTLVVAGDIPKEALLTAATNAFGAWRGRAAAARAPAAPGATRGPTLLLLDRPSAPQTSVALCAVGSPYNGADHDTLMVLNTILSRRLNGNLRGRHAYTYAASSQFAFRHGPGPFTAGGDVVREKTAEAIKEILSEVALLRDEPVGHDELSEAKTIVGALSARFETTDSSASAMTPLAVYGLGDDDFMTLRVRLQLVNREGIQKAAQAYLAPDKLRLAMVGDAAVIEAPVRALNLGSIEVRKIRPAAKPPADLPQDE